MILDAQNLFSEGQALTATATSTNVLDLLGANTDNTTVDIGTGEDIYLIVQTTKAFTQGDEITLTAALQSGANAADLTSSPTVHFTTGALAGAAFKADGSVLAAVRVPPGTYQRYLGVQYTASNTLVAGEVTAFLTKDIDAWRAYATRMSFNAGAAS